MRKAVDYLRAHPIILVAIVVGVVGIFILTRSPSQRVSEPTPPPPQPAASPAPGATPGAAAPAPRVPAPAAMATPTPRPTPRAVTGALGAGRPDPFLPLITSGQGAAPAGVPVPPPAPLPPPLFPGQAPGAPGAPEAPAAPTPPPAPKAASRAELIGVLGDGAGVAIIRLDDKTYIVGQGDVILDKIRVALIDASKRVVVLEEDGERFELKLGGVSGTHVASTSTTHTF